MAYDENNVTFRTVSLFVIETGSTQTPALNHMKPGLSLRDILCIDFEKMDANVRHVKTEEYEGYILERKDEPNPLTLQDIQYIEQVTFENIRFY